MLPEIVETERLRLEPRTPEYVDPFAVYEHCKEGAPNIDEVTEHVPWSAHSHPKESLEFLERGAKLRDEHKAADYVVRPKEGEEGAGEIAGFTGVDFDWEREFVELGLWFRKPFWGRGYSSERALALAELAFEGLDFELLVVRHHVENENSERAIEKYIDRMGGRREGVLRNYGLASVDDGGGVDEVRYSVSRTEYRDADPDHEVTFLDEDGEPWP